MKKLLSILSVFVFLCCLLPAAMAATTDQFVIENNKATVEAGETLQLQVVVGDDFKDCEITWKSGNKKVATVDEAGLVTAANPGNVTITASTKVNGRTYDAAAKITVFRKVSGITVNDRNWPLMNAEDSVLTDVLTLSNEDPVVVLIPGKKLSVKASVTPKDAADKSIVISSDNEEVLSVRRAEVYAKNPGECTLTVASENSPEIAVRYHVLVVKPVQKITVNSETRTVFVGETLQLTPEIEPQDATIRQLTWSSSSEKIGTVDAGGLFTGVGKGTATVTVKANDGTGVKTTAKINVVIRPEQILLKQTDFTMNVGTKKTLGFSVKPNTVSDKKVTWSSSDESVAVVDAKGTVQGIVPGTAVITAASVSAPDITASLTVTIVQPVKKIGFEESKPSVLVGEKLALHAVIQPENATDQSVVWKSANTRVAVVDENGIVTGIKAGKVRITATAADGSRVQGRVDVQVIQPVLGVHMRYNRYNVGVGCAITPTAVLEPADATNKNMTWTVDDASVLSIRGTNNRPRITGRRWGDTIIRGTTEDGGYTTSAQIHVGDYNKALSISGLYLEDNEIKIVVLNESNMNIVRFEYTIYAFDQAGDPLWIDSQTKDNFITGYYSHTLTPGASTRHGRFTFRNFHQPKKTNFGKVILTIDSYRTDDGMNYRIPEDRKPTMTCYSRGYYGE